MPKLTKKAICSERTDGRTDGITDPNYRKASILKILENLPFQYTVIHGCIEVNIVLNVTVVCPKGLY